MSEPVFFSAGIPSNFYQWAVLLPNPFTLEPTEHKTNEHRFQAMKGRTVVEYIWINSAPSAAEAKMRGRVLNLSPAEIYEWDNFRALPVMLEVNLVKFSTSGVCLQWLFQTGDAPLIEHRRDPIWGDNLDGTGRNLLGKILELVRLSLG